MLSRFRRLPSPALVIASIALILAVGGGSFALAISDKKSDKKIAKKAANKVVTKRAPGLSVNHANSADVAGTVREASTAGPVDLIPDPVVSQQVVVSLNLPAGKYLIAAKGWLNNNGSITVRRFCTLNAGPASDTTLVGMDTNSTSDDTTPFALQTEANLASASTVTVSCDRPNSVSDPSVSANNVRIDALSVAGVG